MIWGMYWNFDNKGLLLDEVKESSAGLKQVGVSFCMLLWWPDRLRWFSTTSISFSFFSCGWYPTMAGISKSIHITSKSEAHLIVMNLHLFCGFYYEI